MFLVGIHLIYLSHGLKFALKGKTNSPNIATTVLMRHNYYYELHVFMLIIKGISVEQNERKKENYCLLSCFVVIVISICSAIKE